MWEYYQFYPRSIGLPSFEHVLPFSQFLYSYVFAKL